MRPDQERVRNLLIDTVTLLCKNSLQFKDELHVEGLLGVSVDKKEVFFVHISKEFTNSPSEGATVTQETEIEEETRLAQGSTQKDSDKRADDSNFTQDHIKVKTEVSDTEEECSIVEDPNIKLEGVVSPAQMVAGQRRAFKRTSQSHITGGTVQVEQYSGDDSNLSAGYNLADGGIDASQYGHIGEPPTKRRNDSQDGYDEEEQVQWPTISGVSGFDPSTQTFQDTDSQISGTDSQPGCSTWSSAGRGPSDSMLYYPPLSRGVVHPVGGIGGEHLCTECGKSFPEKWRLVRHRKIHTEARPFKCPLCPYEGRLRECLKRHMRTRHDAQPERASYNGPPRNTNDVDEAVMREIYGKLAMEAAQTVPMPIKLAPDVQPN